VQSRGRRRSVDNRRVAARHWLTKARSLDHVKLRMAVPGFQELVEDVCRRSPIAFSSWLASGSTPRRFPRFSIGILGPVDAALAVRAAPREGRAGRAGHIDDAGVAPGNVQSHARKQAMSMSPLHMATPLSREEHQPGSGGSMRQDSADSAKANRRHELARQRAQPQSILRISQTTHEST
jgi:hypothetical protein